MAGGKTRLVRRRRKYVRKNTKKTSVLSTKVLKLSNKNNSLILPERYCCWMENSLNFYIETGKATAATGNYMCVMATSLWTPFNTTYDPLQIPGDVFVMNGKLVQGNSVLSLPVGYTTMQSLYLNSKVHKYILEFCVMPETGSDKIEIVTFPLGNEVIPSANPLYVNLKNFKGQPYNKSRVCDQGQGSRNKLTIRRNCWDNLGLRKSTFLDTLPTPMGLFPAAQLTGYEGFFIQQIDGTNSAAPICVSIKLRQYVEFTDLNAQIQ